MVTLILWRNDWFSPGDFVYFAYGFCRGGVFFLPNLQEVPVRISPVDVARTPTSTAHLGAFDVRKEIVD